MKLHHRPPVPRASSPQAFAKSTIALGGGGYRDVLLDNAIRAGFVARMRAPLGSARVVLWAAIVLLAGISTGCLGCGEGGGGEEDDARWAEALRASFPEQAARVLGQERGFVATEQGFALDTEGSASGGWRR